MRLFKIFFAFIVCITPIFSQQFSEEVVDCIWQETIKVGKILLDEHPAVVKSFDGETLVIKSENIITKLGNNGIVRLSDGQTLFVPLICEEDLQYYIPFTLKKVGNKLFKLRCNTCGYEWQGGVFDFQCPREVCGSTDIVCLPNW